MTTQTLSQQPTSSVQKTAALVLLAVVCMLVLASAAHAGTGGGDGFDSVWAAISEYLKGTMGRVLVGLIVIVGVAAGVVRQSLMSFAVAVGAAIGLFYSPEIIEGIITSTQAAAGLVLPVGM